MNGLQAQDNVESTVVRLLRQLNVVHRARVRRETRRVRYLRDSFLFLGILARPPATSWPEFDANRALLEEGRTLLHAARQLLAQPVVTGPDVKMARRLMNQAYAKFTGAAKNCPQEPAFFGPWPEEVVRHRSGQGGGGDGGGGGDSAGGDSGGGDSGGGDCGGGGDGGGGGCD